MSRTKHTEVYSFDELEDSAKEKAREQMREFQADDDWYDCVCEGAATCADFLGIDLRTKSVKLMGGGTRNAPCIYFSGFSSQGDGACFEGTWRADSVRVDQLREHAPQDKELNRIAEELGVIAVEFPAAMASIEHRGRYYHSGCMTIEVSEPDNYDDNGLVTADDFPDCEIVQLMRDFADWIYSQLDAEHTYRNADEQIDDNIRANEYEFTADGRIV